ncbi:MAG: iron-sulfur cluster assembly protein IscA [Pseudomonadota bacterium]|nr:iron-sulfur cluster assembly protein IscA [Pseudomonadota bacterium]MEC8996359.1 iron-sulfur cluster assembly protein IscA [Pseudomonadota bacterium]MED5274538.1 iron-sulfur cluster assembly protein IscA [Pseudomonadota bacterium]|tara:strand:- start:674 stop:997 length:324 start_codon:yes stop_codon:yes gene_type:complete
MSISVTKIAAEHAQKHLSARGKGIGLRLGVKTTGCSGLAYVIEFADKIENDDLVFDDNGIKIIINPKSYVYLKGTELDFSKEGLNEGFRFKNPNVKDECGCGESFNV